MDGKKRFIILVLLLVLAVSLGLRHFEDPEHRNGMRVLLSAWFPDALRLTQNTQEFLADRCIYQATKSSCFIDRKRLDQKIKAGLPDWAMAQIKSDLERFPKISKANRDKLHQDWDMLLRVQVKDGQAHATYSNNLNILYAYKDMMDLFQFLAKNKYIPNTDFFMGLSDYLLPSTPSTLFDQIPIFVFAKDMNDPLERNWVAVPDWMNLEQMPKLQARIRKANQQWPWERKLPILFWRGGNCASTLFRQELVALSAKMPERIDAKFPDKAKVPFVKQEDHLRYKYLISIDGARATWTRLVWHLQANSLTFKHDSSQMQWYYNAIKPYEHYVPVRDTQALVEALNWADQNEAAVRKMVDASTRFVEENLTLEDMYHYFIVLLQEYTKKLD